jgi:hypothetical protein
MKLKTGEISVICGFSENRSIIQDEVQGFFTETMQQATIHPFVAYNSHNEVTDHISFVVASDCLKHDTVAVHLFLKKVHNVLSGKLRDLRFTIFLMVLPCSIKAGKILSTSATIQIT